MPAKPRPEPFNPPPGWLAQDMELAVKQRFSVWAGTLPEPVLFASTRDALIADATAAVKAGRASIGIPPGVLLALLDTDAAMESIHAYPA